LHERYLQTSHCKCKSREDEEEKMAISYANPSSSQ
jgi:hypothetical protein